MDHFRVLVAHHPHATAPWTCRAGSHSIPVEALGCDTRFSHFLPGTCSLCILRSLLSARLSALRSRLSVLRSPFSVLCSPFFALSSPFSVYRTLPLSLKSADGRSWKSCNRFRRALKRHSSRRCCNRSRTFRRNYFFSFFFLSLRELGSMS